MFFFFSDSLYSFHEPKIISGILFDLTKGLNNITDFFYGPWTGVDHGQFKVGP